MQSSNPFLTNEFEEKFQKDKRFLGVDPSGISQGN